MNAKTNLPVDFAPGSELTSWEQPVKVAEAASASGARATARFTVRVFQNATPVKFQQRSGVNAAFLPHRFSRQRLCTPNHTPNRLAP